VQAKDRKTPGKEHGSQKKKKRRKENKKAKNKKHRNRQRIPFSFKHVLAAKETPHKDFFFFFSFFQNETIDENANLAHRAQILDVALWK
jgi:hypothetical protein